MSSNEVSDLNKISDAGKGIFEPNYFLDDSDLISLEKSMYEYAGDTAGSGVHALLIDPTHPFSNYVRTQEELTFPGAGNELSLAAELDTRQLALVDTRRRSRSIGKIAFVGTVSGFRDKAISDNETTGIVAVDELIAIPENAVTAEQFNEYFIEQGVSPQRIIGVETSIKLINGMQKYHALRTAQLAYLAMFKIAEGLPKAEGNNDLGFGVVARANPQTALSTKRTGISAELLMGRTDWITPELGDAEPYSPVIYNNKKNRILSLMKYAAPKIIEIAEE